MSLLNKLTTEEGIGEERDTLGGGSYIWESDVYPVTVAMAYLSESQSGATAVNLVFKGKSGELRNQQYVTSNAANGGRNYYEDKKTGEKHYLPGFNIANAICLLAVGKELTQMTTSLRHVPVYNSVAKAEVPTEVEVLTELLGKKLVIGVLKTRENKRAQDSTGTWVATSEEKTFNEVDKIFDADKLLTVPEIRAQKTDPEFHAKWLEANKGRLNDKYKEIIGGGATGAPPRAAGGAPGASAAAGKPKGSLFAKPAPAADPAA